MSAPDFPTIVYRCPGDWFGPRGTTFTSVGVDNAEQLAARLADGWHRTQCEAVEAYLAPQSDSHPDPDPEPQADLESEPEPQAEPEQPAADEPPTREEMLAQAAKIGLRVDRRWSDETLMARISAAMAPTNEDPI